MKTRFTAKATTAATFSVAVSCAAWRATPNGLQPIVMIHPMPKAAQTILYSEVCETGIPSIPGVSSTPNETPTASSKATNPKRTQEAPAARR